jgi:hypothetical protein
MPTVIAFAEQTSVIATFVAVGLLMVLCALATWRGWGI